MAMRFFDATGKMIYESAYKDAFDDSELKQHEIMLQEGERIVGFVSRRFAEGCAAHLDFQFIIGIE